MKQDREHSWEPWRHDGERWELCKHCKLARQTFDEFGKQFGGGNVGPRSKDWRLMIEGRVFWADWVPACRRGTWKTEALPEGERPAGEIEAGVDRVFVCAGVCVTLECQCHEFDGLVVDEAMQHKLMAFNLAAVTPVHEGCTCYVTGIARP